MALLVGVGGDLAAEPQQDVRDVRPPAPRPRPLERLELDPAVDRRSGRDGAVSCLSRKRSRDRAGRSPSQRRRAQLATGAGASSTAAISSPRARSTSSSSRRRPRAAPRPSRPAPSASRPRPRACGIPRAAPRPVAGLQRTRREPSGGPARPAFAAQPEPHRQPRAVHGGRLDRDRPADRAAAGRRTGAADEGSTTCRR